MGKLKTKNKNIATALLLAVILFSIIVLPLASASNNTQWNLPITNLSGTTITFTYDDLLALPKTIVSADLSCYGNFISNGAWGGVKLLDLLNQAGIDTSVATVDFFAQDGYSVSIPINTAMRTDVIVAYDLDGALLTEVLRLVVPDANGNIWIAKITSINTSMSSVDQVQSGTSGQTIINQYQALVNLTTQAPQQPQPIVQIQPITSSNETTIEPVTPPTNVTVPQSEQKIADQQDVVPSFDSVYWVLLGVIIATVAVSVLVYSRKKNSTTQY